MTEQKTVSKRYYPELDGLRAIAILLVMWWHSSLFAYNMVRPQDILTGSYMSVTILGAGGVCLFFVLSGFLITGILMDLAEKKNYLRHFYLRRSLRIFPVYYLGLIVISVLSFIYVPNINLSERIWVYALYLQNIDEMMLGIPMFHYGGWDYFEHFWSLAIEAQFYLIWPLCFVFMYRRFSFAKCLSVMVAASILSASIRYGMTFGSSWQYAYILPFSRVDGLLLGSIIAYVMRARHDVFIALKKIANLAIPILPMLLPLIVLYCVKFGYGSLELVNIRYLVLLEVICSSCLLVFVVGRSKNENSFMQLLCSKFMKNIARVSYGVYIFNLPVLFILDHHLSNLSYMGYWPLHAIMFLVGGVLTYIVASISFHLFEKPVLRMKDKYVSIE